MDVASFDHRRALPSALASGVVLSLDQTKPASALLYGTTLNAVRIQLWSAMCAYLAVAIARKRLCLTESMTTVLQIVSINAFQKTPLAELFATSTVKPSIVENRKQLNFNEF